MPESSQQVAVERQATVKAALLRYRVMAYIVGTLLVVLVCVGVPLKYLAADESTRELGGRVVMWTGIPHGWLYMILLVTAWDLGRRVAWSWTRLILIALAGTIPFLSFVAEYSARHDVRRRLGLESTKQGGA